MQREKERVLLECVFISSTFRPLSTSVEKSVDVCTSLAFSPSVSCFSILCAVVYPSIFFCILVSSVSLRGGLFDLFPTPLFWPQSSNPPPHLPKHLRVWQVRERWHSPDTSPLLFHLPLCSCLLTPALASCVPHHDTLPPPPPSSVITLFFFPVFPSALTCNCGPVLPPSLPHLHLCQA